MVQGYPGKSAPLEIEAADGKVLRDSVSASKDEIRELPRRGRTRRDAPRTVTGCHEDVLEPRNLADQRAAVVRDRASAGADLADRGVEDRRDERRRPLEDPLRPRRWIRLIREKRRSNR